jgi:hypothetical protein
MRTARSLLPLTVAIALVGAVTWFLLDRDIAAGRWLLAALLFAHGWVHLVFLFPQPSPAAATSDGIAWPFDMERSWLIGGAGLDPSLVRRLGIALAVAVFAAFALAALATLGWLIPAGWWDGLVIGGALGSTLMLTLFFSPALVLGFAIDLALAWLVLGSVWVPPGSMPS